MRYYPLNRVKTNQKASGDDFLLNGVAYTGPYYQTYDGGYYTGADPIQGPSEKLTKIIMDSEDRPRPAGDPQGTPISGNVVAYSASKNLNISTLATYQTPKPYYPKPSEDDYARKSFMRYFAKKRNQPGFVIEVDKATHDSLKNTDSIYDYVNYESISTFWQLVGPLHDTRTNKQYKIAGIIDTNERLINAKEPSFLGLKAFIGEDYAKFARPTR